MSRLRALTPASSRQLLLRDRERALVKYEAMRRKLGGSGEGGGSLVAERALVGLGRTTREDEEVLRQQRVANYKQCVKNTDEVRRGGGAK